MKAKKPSAKERAIRDLIKGQEQKIERAQKRIDELNHQLTEHLATPQEPEKPPVKDDHEYCGKILYTSKKAANKARILINRDLKKEGKPTLRRSYFCDLCEAWHLTTVPHWMPFREIEVAPGIII